MSARILHGDIVTTWGVIHLIDTPLVIRTQTVLEILAAPSNERYRQDCLNIHLNSHL